MLEMLKNKELRKRTRMLKWEKFFTCWNITNRITTEMNNYITIATTQ